ncbi:MAG: hypothetical protein ABIY55_35565 [Kofleriaceae bacterium]
MDAAIGDGQLGPGEAVDLADGIEQVGRVAQRDELYRVGPRRELDPAAPRRGRDPHPGRASPVPNIQGLVVAVRERLRHVVIERRAVTGAWVDADELTVRHQHLHAHAIARTGQPLDRRRGREDLGRRSLPRATGEHRDLRCTERE